MARYVLGSKSTVTFDQFDYVRKHIEEYVSRSECESKLNKAVDDVRSLIQNRKAGYCWSAGKDSLALQVVMEHAGVDSCVFCTSPQESPVFLDWVRKHHPVGMQTHVCKTLSKQFILDHWDRVFPHKENHWWYRFVPWEGEEAYIKQNALDICFYGRRSQDGNQCYREGRNWYKKKSDNCITANPIADWKHEDVLAVIHYYLNDEMPPMYDKRTDSIPETLFWFELKSWHDVNRVYPELIPVLGEYFPEAKQFINQ